MPTSTRPITIAIGALGGQGGGVLSDWLVHTAERSGYIAQSTAVAGVAQRTGATIYCVEVFPEPPKGEPSPVLALYPVPGDVDLMVGAELIEAGRAVQRGFVTPDVTTLVASTHRVYSMDERVAMGDARADDEAVIKAARAASKQLVAFDMDEPALRHGTVISSVLLGAIAGSGALPFSREHYEAAIRSGGRGVEQSLAAFAEGYRRASEAGGSSDAERAVVRLMTPEPTSEWGRAMRARVEKSLPATCLPIVMEGVRRCADYQDRRYAETFVDHVEQMMTWDADAAATSDDHLLLREYARYLTLRMCYEDTIRVADLKTRRSRFERFHQEVQAADGQIVNVVEYMHPRLEEVCDTLPAGIARKILGSARLRGWLGGAFGRGRNFTTTHVFGFWPQHILASLRRWRRGTYRYALEMERIAEWQAEIKKAVSRDRELAIELVRCARLIKGYGETHERGLERHARILNAVSSNVGVTADDVRGLCEAALQDEQGNALDQALAHAAAR